MSCRVMGIVNVTPDSFSDGGCYFKAEEAVRRAKNLVADGADIIDLGGESTRPGATPITWKEEWNRLEAVLAELVRTFERSNVRTLLSVDTYHVETAERAIAFGARIINCVKPESTPDMLKLLEANSETELVLPSSVNLQPSTLNLQPRLYLDPMIGFGTTREEDIGLLRSISELAKRGRVLVGASRKRIVKKLTGAEGAVGKNIGGNVAIAVWAAMNGASVVRVHDVKETVQALRVVAELQGSKVNVQSLKLGE